MVKAIKEATVPMTESQYFVKKGHTNLETHRWKIRKNCPMGIFTGTSTKVKTTNKPVWQ
jgi:hypothetical protein